MFPLGMHDTLSYPTESSVIFTDSIPLFALFFKFISPIIPSNFQFFGLWGIVCFVLHGLVCAKIINRHSKSRVFTICAVILCVYTPIMLRRMYGHTSLAAQWILLYGLEMIFNYKDYRHESKKLSIHVLLLSIFSCTTHIYFVLMNGIILVGIYLYDILDQKQVQRPSDC